MRQITSLMAFTVAMVFLSGCVMTRSQLREREAQRETQQQQAAMQQAYALELEEQMRALNGRIETLENQLQQARAEKQALEVKRETDRKEYDAKLKVYEEALTKIEQQYLTVSQKLEALQQANAAKESAAKKAPKGSFEQAEENFKKKNYQQAITEYQAYRENNPKGKNYAEATYKIGVSFQELGMKSEALPFFNEVIEKFPKSKSAEKAKIRLKQIK